MHVHGCLLMEPKSTAMTSDIHAGFNAKVPEFHLNEQVLGSWCQQDENVFEVLMKWEQLIFQYPREFILLQSNSFPCLWKGKNAPRRTLLQISKMWSKKRLTCQMKLLLISNNSNSASNSASISLISCVHIPVIYGTFEASQVVPQKSGSLKSCHVHQVHLRTGGIPLPKVFVDFDIINVHDRHANLAGKKHDRKWMDAC